MTNLATLKAISLNQQGIVFKKNCLRGGKECINKKEQTGKTK